MTDLRADFGGSIPEMYERAMAPVMFAPVAELMARRAAALMPQDVLETACGTGQVTRRLAAMLPASARLVATDLAPAMLDQAAPRLPGFGAAVTLQQGDAQALAFPAASFDLMICGFGVMFFPDRALALREALRVLRPGGRFLFTTWDTRAANPFARIAQDVVAEHLGPGGGAYGLAFGMHGWDAVKDLALEAGFGGFRAELLRLAVPVPDIPLFAAGLLHGNPSGQLLRSKGIDTAPLVERVAARLAAEFGTPPCARLQALLFEAVKE